MRKLFYSEMLNTRRLQLHKCDNWLFFLAIPYRQSQCVTLGSRIHLFSDILQRKQLINLENEKGRLTSKENIVAAPFHITTLQLTARSQGL